MLEVGSRVIVSYENLDILGKITDIPNTYDSPYIVKLDDGTIKHIDAIDIRAYTAEKKESSIKHFNLKSTLEQAIGMVNDKNLEVVESVVKHDRQDDYKPGRHSIQIEIILKETE